MIRKNTSLISSMLADLFVVAVAVVLSMLLLFAVAVDLYVLGIAFFTVFVLVTLFWYGDK